MEEPRIAQQAPFEVEVEEGRNYAWCACGESATQPWCDGSHKDTPWTPVVWKAERSGTLYLCGCKRTGDRPRCDGTHAVL